jgi:hypothetical protein
VGTQLVDALVVLVFPILFFYARVLKRIYKPHEGAVLELRSTKGLQQWWHGGSKELVNSNNLHSPPFIASR